MERGKEKRRGREKWRERGREQEKRIMRTAIRCPCQQPRGSDTNGNQVLKWIGVAAGEDEGGARGGQACL